MLQIAPFVKHPVPGMGYDRESTFRQNINSNYVLILISVPREEKKCQNLRRTLGVRDAIGFKKGITPKNENCQHATTTAVEGRDLD